MRKSIPRICWLALAVGFACSHPARAQAQSNLEFEAATIKPFDPSHGWAPGIKGGPGTSDPGRISIKSWLKGLLMTAYGVNSDRISGPAWLDTNSQLYIVEATIRPGATKEQMAVMLQNLLKQRFQITLHRETRDVPLYELTVAGKGPQLKAYVEGSFATGGRGMPGGADFPMEYVSGGVEHASANQATITQLIKYLSLGLKRPVVDNTGLSGLYNYNLDYALDLSANADDVSTASAPDLITAVRQQLGMKLTAKKGPLEIIVIDGAEKTPIEN